MAKMLRMSAGVLVGVLVGVGLVLLLTPRSGSELRRLMRERVDLILEEGRQAARARQQELTAQFEALKQPSQR
jgi:gas vesicle protein